MRTNTRLLLAAALLAYAVLGVLYAIYTPLWQVPDEPAHYNYIHSLAEEGTMPVMEEGDYDQDHINQLTSQRFPPDLSVASLTYEDHQPPLYYLIAAPVYLLFDGAPLPLRLFSMSIGLALLVVAYGLVCSLFPSRPFLAVTTATLIAFLPQHIAMMAGIENDGLAEVLLGATLWMLVRYVQGKSGGRQFFVGLGLTLGLCVLTKTAAYVALPVTLLALWLRARREEKGQPGQVLRRVAARAGWVILAAALLAGPWLVRNAALYGWSDPLGLGRHNAVVVGQLRTADALGEYGWSWLVQRSARFTFQSFWGQFGWMAVPLQPAIYLALALLSTLFLAGFLGWLLDRQRPRLEPTQSDGMILLGTSALLTLAAFVWYNLTFVQHQGRYLFPALIPLALGAALGLEWVLSPRVARWAAAALVGLGIVLGIWGVIRGDLPVVPMGTALGLAGLCGLATLWDCRGRNLATALLALGLVALDVYALFWALVPTLAR